MAERPTVFFKSVNPLPDHKLEVVMETDTYVLLDFSSRIRTARFNSFWDEEYFSTARTDGKCIIFGEDKPYTKIFLETFVELVLGCEVELV